MHGNSSRPRVGGPGEEKRAALLLLLSAPAISPFNTSCESTTLEFSSGLALRDVFDARNSLFPSLVLACENMHHVQLAASVFKQMAMRCVCVYMGWALSAVAVSE
eukprot:6179445-Pleurochrysis_carterae.AAC.1